MIIVKFISSWKEKMKKRSGAGRREEFVKNSCKLNVRIDECVILERSHMCILCMQREEQAQSRNNEYCT